MLGLVLVAGLISVQDGSLSRMDLCPGMDVCPGWISFQDGYLSRNGSLSRMDLCPGWISVQDGSLSRMDLCPGWISVQNGQLWYNHTENVLNLSKKLAPIDPLVCIVAHKKIRIRY